MTNSPPLFGASSSPCSLTIAASIPSIGIVHEPGLVVVTPGIGVTTCPPVSVCQ
jgi:hypothetical protein